MRGMLLKAFGTWGPGLLSVLQCERQLHRKKDCLAQNASNLPTDVGEFLCDVEIEDNFLKCRMHQP